MTREDLIQLTKTYVDEAAPFSQASVSLSPNKRPLEDQLGICLDDVFRVVYSDVDVSRVSCEPITVTTSVVDGVMLASIDEEFIRLKQIKLSSWERDVSELTLIGSPKYVRQQNEFTRANQSKPVVVLYLKSEDDTVFKLYSPVNTDDSIEVFDVVWNWGIENVQEDLISALCWAAAVQYFSTIGADPSYSIEMYKKQL